MEKPSHEEREALRLYMAAMEGPTQRLHEGMRACNRVMNQGPVNLLPAPVLRKLVTDLRALRMLPGELPGTIPQLAEAGHARWIQWFQAAIEAGDALAAAIELRNGRLFEQAKELANALPELRNEIISPDMNAWCLDDSILEDPITADEYAEMIRVRKSNDYPPRSSEAWDRWSALVCRHWFQFPNSVDRELWHEAGHIVVGHRLGWQVQSIDRHPDGTPFANIPPPCEFPELPILDYSTVAVAGYLAEEKAFGNALPSQDHINIAREFKSSEARQGHKATPATNLAHVLEAEARAQVILDENWHAVQRLAEVAIGSLPVNRPALLRELRDVKQDEPACGPEKDRGSGKNRRPHSLITARRRD